MKTVLVPLVAAAALVSARAGAHHSAAMFDASTNLTLAGTVKEFQWTSPHCWIQLLVEDPEHPDDAPVEWGIEMDNPMGLLRHGWKATTLKPGDKVVAIVHPLRDGQPGAQIVSVTRADGTPIGK